jgi:hypothetical protein
MPFLDKPFGAARTAVVYVTVGALIDVWTVIYWLYLSRHPEGHTEAALYWVYGFFFTGIVLLVIGLALGRIGRAARHAEMLPEVPGENTAGAPANSPPPTAPAPIAPQVYALPGQVAVAVPPQSSPTPAVPVRRSTPVG